MPASRIVELLLRRLGGAAHLIYLVDAFGNEVLLHVEGPGCFDPMPLAARPRPPVLPTKVKLTEEVGRFYISDVYRGTGMERVPRGTIKNLRVVALELRAAGIRKNLSKGEAGGALSSTPISIGNGAWDVKKVLGDARVHPDGSACFIVPARTPVYFQDLDERGYALQAVGVFKNDAAVTTLVVHKRWRRPGRPFAGVEISVQADDKE